MRSILIYNLYPKNNWKEVTEIVLGTVKFHESIIVNISLDKFDRFFLKHKYYSRYLKKKHPKIIEITFTLNNPKLGEVVGFDMLRSKIDYDKFDIVTYTHSKGVTKPKNKNVKDWVKMMTYFLVERHDLCIEAFNKDYSLYGTRLHKYNYDKVRIGTYKYCDYWYAGTFVSVNLKRIKKEFISTNCPNNYYGVESFFGLLCEYNKMYNVHSTGENNSLYDNSYPEENYKT